MLYIPPGDTAAALSRSSVNHGIVFKRITQNLDILQRITFHYIRFSRIGNRFFKNF